jgi:hypothetical protein
VEWSLVKVKVVLLAAAALTACGYSDRFANCAVSCDRSLGCPDGLSCGSDHICRRSAEDLCGETIDGAAIDATIDRTLVGWWNLDEGSGTVTADSSGNSNAGVLLNGAVWTTGKFGNAVMFNGVDQYVSLSDSADLQVGGTNILTITAWIRRGTSTAAGGIVTKKVGGSPVGGYTLAVGVSPCTLNQIKATKYGVADICLGAVPTDMGWHHLALVFSGAGVIDYIDGIPDATDDDTRNFVSNADAPAIGAGVNGGYFNGSIDDVRIYKRALSATDIMMLQ